MNDRQVLTCCITAVALFSIAIIGPAGCLRDAERSLARRVEAACATGNLTEDPARAFACTQAVKLRP